MTLQNYSINKHEQITVTYNTPSGSIQFTDSDFLALGQYVFSIGGLKSKQQLFGEALRYHFKRWCQHIQSYSQVATVQPYYRDSLRRTGLLEKVQQLLQQYNSLTNKGIAVKISRMHTSLGDLLPPANSKHYQFSYNELKGCIALCNYYLQIEEKQAA